jgi:hypothetical protein
MLEKKRQALDTPAIPVHNQAYPYVGLRFAGPTSHLEAASV